MIKNTIVNVVATASLNQELDFYELRRYSEIFYDSDVYGGRVAYFKTENMKGKVSIFASGKLISVGTKSQQNAFSELQTVARFLFKKGLAKPVKLSPKIRNMVISVHLEKNLNLAKLAKNSKAVYEPERFPALILRLEKPCRVGILIFASGKVIIAGLTSSDQIEPIIQQVQKLVDS